MTPPSPADPAAQGSDEVREGLLEEVLGEYMQRLDRGEVVDREQLLARHPHLVEELRSYFAASDELERLRRQDEGAEPPTDPLRPRPPAFQQPAPDGNDARPPGAQPPQGKPRRVGDYELLEKIGEGGMGVIYKARQVSLQRLVALKMIRPDRLAAPADVAGRTARFRSEAEAVASLDHPAIVPIYEIDEHEGQPFFSMKLIEGGSLARQLPRLAQDLAAGAGILAAVARAVHYAHQRGLLHRDLKPANILLDADGRPHVTDFGLAKRLAPRPRALQEPAQGSHEGWPEEAALTQQGVIVGTPNYMAPEQATGKGGVTTAADVYSLGAILYELLTGRTPFAAEIPLETLRQLLEQEPAPPRSLNRRVDRDLETVCLKCLHKEPNKRYGSAEALADDLERWLRGEPVRARPVSRRERAWKWVRRRPHLAALAVLLVLALILGFAGVYWQKQRAEDEAHRATQLAEAERQTAYARAISLAYAEWRAGNAGPAQQVLGACHPELREWEWHYLSRLFQARQLATLEGHTAGVLAVAFSPDGKRLASGDAKGVVKVWDRRSLRATLSLRGHTAAVRAVAFSPDGKSLASGGADGAVRLWDSASGQRLVTLAGHAAGVTGLAFDPTGRDGDHRLAFTGGEPFNGVLRLWGDPTKGKAPGVRPWHNLLAAVAFSPDGKSLATAGPDGSVTAWDVATLKPVRAFRGQTERTVPWASVALSTDGKWLAAGSPHGVVQVWHAATARELFSALTPTQAGVWGLAFGGPKGRILAAATAENTVQGWFTRSGLPAFTLRGHTRAVRAVACSPDGRCLASASEDRTVKLWDLRQRDDDRTFLWIQGVTSIAFSPDGTRLASATRDHALNVWDVTTGKATLTLWGLSGAPTGLAFSPDGSLLACACEDGAVRLRDVLSRRHARREVAVLRGHTGRVQAVAFRPDGAGLASAGADGTVRIWDVPSGQEAFCLAGHRGPVHATAFSPDGRLLASAGEDGSRVWDAATGREVRALGADHGPAYAVAFSPDGRHLAAAGRDEAIRIWDTATGRLAGTLHGHAGAVRSLAYGPGGRLASAGDDKAVRLWDAAGRELLALRGHTEALRAVAFSPDGHRLASAGDDRTLKVWDGTPLDPPE
jgi:WD40 repeat protein